MNDSSPLAPISPLLRRLTYRRPESRKLPTLAIAWLASLVTAICLLPGAARADDTDIYRTLPPTTKLLTILSLDLNGNPNTVVCNNVLIDPNGSSGIPTVQVPACSALRAGMTVETFIESLQPYVSATLLATIEGGSPIQDQLGTPLANLSSGARAYLLTAVGQLQTVVNAAQAAAVAAGTNPSGAPASLVAFTQGQTLIGVAAELTRGLVGGKLALMINHANVGTTSTANGVTYACNFNDVFTSLDPTVTQNRKDTKYCSNGAYFLMGFVDIGDVTASALTALSTPTQVTASLSKAMAAAMGLAGSVLSTSTPVPASVSASTTPILPPYQGREVYDEVGHYLEGLQTFNAKLGTYDFAYGQSLTVAGMPTNVLVGTSVPRDTTIESSDTYISPLAAAPSCDINLVHIQTTNSQQDADSDLDLPKVYDTPDLNSDGQLTYPEMSQAAADHGFIWQDRRYKLKSTFLIQQSLTDALNLNIGSNAVFPFTDTVGLLGSVRAIGKQLSPTLVISATMAGDARPNRVDLYGSSTTPIYEALFQPVADQKPNWLGNLKRLELKYNSTTSTFSVQDYKGYPAYDPNDGRIAATAFTGFSPTAVADGRIVNQGGAGAQIPGYIVPTYDSKGVHNNTTRGKPGFTNSDIITTNGASPRVLYTDQLTPQVSTTVLGVTTVVTPATLQLVNLDDDLSNNITSNTKINLESIAQEIGATSVCALPTVANAQRWQQAIDAVLYARGFEIGTSTATASSSSAATCPTTAPTLDHHNSTGTCANGSTSSACVGARDWLMGAVLHSRPVAINYGSATSPNIKVLVGSADGYLRMIDGTTGAEQWGFMPQQALAQQPSLRTGVATTALPYGLDGPVSVVYTDRSPTGGAADGVINPSNPYDSVIAYFGLRRTGNTYYALDITNPAVPKLLWRLGNDGLYRFLQAASSGGVTAPQSLSANASGTLYNTSATLTSSKAVGTTATNPKAAYADMGLAFSQPSIGKVQLCNAASTATSCTLETYPRTVLLLGGGYNGRAATSSTNTGKDLNNSTNTTLTPTDLRVGQNDSVGNAVYVVDAASGDLIWRAEAGTFSSTAPYLALQTLYSHPMLQDGIVGPLNAIDTTGDGLTDRTYFGDMGGRVWRMDLSSPYTSTWTLTPLASVGRQATSGSFPNDRRFTSGIDYVPTRVNGIPYDALVFGTGDREDPRNTVTQDYLYALFDPDTTNGRTATDTSTYAGVISTESDTRLFKQASFNTCSGTTACSPNLPTSVTDMTSTRQAGWKIMLPVTGQKVVTQPITLDDIIFATSYIPGQIATSSCIPQEGYSVGSVYRLDTGLFDQASLALITGSNKATSSTTSNSILTSGYAGASMPVDAINTLVQGHNGSAALGQQTPYFTSWRERRGDEP